MPAVRVLNAEGLAKFSEYWVEVRASPSKPPPFDLLTDGRYSDPFDPQVNIELRSFDTAYEIGQYMVDVFANCEDRLISRNHALWSWLALFYFDQLCRPDASGNRKVLQESLYVLEERFSFQRYYKHSIRTPWAAVKLHGEFAKVLLLTVSKGTRTDITESLGGYQDIFGNKTIIASAYAMYFDGAQQRPRKGAGGKGGGSARRLANVCRQLDLTYDLQECSPTQFFALLPKEFKAWIRLATGTA